jgi:alanine dehydrogenase
MLVGVPREIKTHEYRVGLTPAAVREYIAHGHAVLIERGAGAGIGVSDDLYERVGATLTATAADIFRRAEMIVKVKEPQATEWVQLREGQILFTYLHLAADPEQTQGLLRSRCTAVAYETVTDENGGLPLLAPDERGGRTFVN